MIIMKKLHTFHSWEQPMAGMFRELLATEGVACLVRNEQLSTAIGEIPFVECFPELWVIDDEIYPRAKLLLEAWLKQSPEVAPWTCPQCGEEIDGQFSSCWSCGSSCD